MQIQFFQTFDGNLVLSLKWTKEYNIAWFIYICLWNIQVINYQQFLFFLEIRKPNYLSWLALLIIFHQGFLHRWWTSPSRVTGRWMDSLNKTELGGFQLRLSLATFVSTRIPFKGKIIFTIQGNKAFWLNRRWLWILFWLIESSHLSIDGCITSTTWRVGLNWHWLSFKADRMEDLLVRSMINQGFVDHRIRHLEFTIVEKLRCPIKPAAAMFPYNLAQ